MSTGGTNSPNKRPTPGQPAGKRPAGSAFTGYGKDAPSLENMAKEMFETEAAEKQKPQAVVAEEQSASAQAPVVMLINTILKEAVKRRASDIHIEPFEDVLRVRFRVDGTLQEIQKLPHRLTNALISRLKIMAELDIVERRIPQDGSIRIRGTGEEESDFRISVLPSVFGEKAVMRVLGKQNLNNDLGKIGMPDDQLKLLREAIQRPDGLVLVTGPTGSGKTTTLYAALNELNDISTSVYTAEDPVEGTIKGITQVQVNDAVGLNFPIILRSLLRQDPDIILVGEIRDLETVDIAIKASLTGHVVLSTLHTNDTTATVQRLLNMGVLPYLISSSVTLIVAQRLVRRICEACKEPAPLNPALIERFGAQGAALKGSGIFTGKGCDACGNTGYKGRAPIYEVLYMSDGIKDLILKGAPQSELRKFARMEKMVTLREAGIRLIQQGITTLEEVLGGTNEDSEG